MSSQSAAAIAFYTGLLTLATGAIRFARARIERKRRDPFAIVLAGLGGLLLIISLLLHQSSPHKTLPY